MLSTETILSNVFNGPTTSPDRNHDATTSGATTTTSIHSTATTMQVTKKNRRRDRSSDDDSTTAAAAAADGTDTLSSHTSNTITSKKANIRNEKDHHHNDDLLVAPIIIGAGQGTTGTHFFAEVTCHLGYTSIHYHAGCIPNHNHKDKDKDKNNPPPESTKYSSLSTNNKQNISFSSASPEATVVPKNYKNLQYNQRCLIKQFRALWSSFLPPALYRNQTLDLLEGIIVFGKENGVFLALYDTPYPFLVPQIIKLVRKHYHGRRPILLLSEREPFSYAKRRVEMHGHDHMMCKNTSTTTTTIDPVTLEGGAFDIIGCIEKALDGISEEQANQLVVGDLFESMNQAYEVKGAAYVAKEVEMYQNAVRGLADFSFDMFARKEKTQVKDLASRMQSKLDSMDVLVKDKGQFDVCTAEHDCVMDIVNYAKNFNVPGMIYNQERFKEQCTRKNGVRKTGGPTNQTAIVKLSSGAINPCAQVCEMISFN